MCAATPTQWAAVITSQQCTDSKLEHKPGILHDTSSSGDHATGSVYGTADSPNNVDCAPDNSIGNYGRANTCNTGNTVAFVTSSTNASTGISNR